MKRTNKTMGGWFRATILDPALWVTLVVSLVIAFIGNEAILRSARVDIGIAQVGISAALLGVVLAGLSILFVFLNEDYIKLIAQVPLGIEADLWPFKYTALIAIICAAFGMLLILIGNPPPLIFRIVLWLSLWSFSYLLWLFYDVVKFINGHIKARIKQIHKQQGK